VLIHGTDQLVVAIKHLPAPSIIHCAAGNASRHVLCQPLGVMSVDAFSLPVLFRSPFGYQLLHALDTRELDCKTSNTTPELSSSYL